MFFSDEAEAYAAQGTVNADEIVDSVTESGDLKSADDRFEEAERRILLAMHYREAMKSGIFPAGTDAAEVVNKEVADFLRGRLESLLGMSDSPKQEPTPIPVALPFSDAQIQALSMLADSLLRKNAPPAAPAPLEKASLPELPTVAVSLKAIPNRLVTTNQAKLPKQSAQATQIPAKTPVTPAAKSKAKLKAPPKTKQGKIDYNAIENGKPFEENGQVYQFVVHPNATDENGNQIRVKQIVTGQVVPPNVMRMPTDKAGIEKFMAETAAAADTSKFAFNNK